MKNKYTNIKIMLLLYIFLIINTMIFNYLIDPYNIFQDKQNYLSTELRKMPETWIKFNNRKFNSVIIGGSPIESMQFEELNNNLAVLAIYRLELEKMLPILTFFLSKHPEVKKVYIPIDIYQISYMHKNKHKQKIETKITIKEIITLFLSFNTTKKSFQKLYHTETIKGTLKQDKTKTKYIKPDLYSKHAYENYLKLYTYLKSKKIEMVFFITPTHADSQKKFYNIYKKEIFEMKRKLTKITGKVIDFSLLNSQNTVKKNSSNYNKYYLDDFHPRKEYAKLIYSILNKKSDELNTLYTILTSANAELELRKQEELLKKYTPQ